MIRALFMGLLWGIGFRLYLFLAIAVGCPVGVVNRLSIEAGLLATFLWYVLPPWRSNDELVKEDRG